MKAAGDHETIWLTNCTIVDGNSTPGREGMTIRITDGRISAVIDSHDWTASAEPGRVVNLEGNFVVPAFWDVHCHPGTNGPQDLRSDPGPRQQRIRKNLQRCRTHGVTGVRALGEAVFADVTVRDELAEGSPASFGMYVAGPALKPPGGHGSTSLGDQMPAGSLSDAWGSLECVGPEGFGRTARQLIRDQDLDWVKVFVSGGIAGDQESHTDTHMTRDEIAAVCREAHHHGVRVAAHAGNPEAIEMAVLAGVDSIEHGYEMTTANADLLAAHGVWYVPTLSITHNRERMRTMAWSAETIAKATALAPTHRESIRLAKAAGVQLACGSDMRPLGRAGIEEAVLLVEECLSPDEVLRIATVDSARLCRASSDHGTVELGKWANFIVTESDPLLDFCAVLEPRAVLHRGRPVDGGFP